MNPFFFFLIYRAESFSCKCFNKVFPLGLNIMEILSRKSKKKNQTQNTTQQREELVTPIGHCHIKPRNIISKITDLKLFFQKKL